MEEFSSLYAALDLVESGYEIYPLSANTKIPPKGHHGYSEATRDQNTIWDWFQNNPDYNLGLRLDTSHLKPLWPHAIIGLTSMFDCSSIFLRSNSV